MMNNLPLGRNIGCSIWIFIGLFLCSNAWCAGVDHHLWDQFLQKHVKNGLVDYRKIKERPYELNQYLQKIATFPRNELTRLPSSEQIAFYINAYNAITIKRIIDHYPPEKKGFLNFLNPSVSIKNISGVWDRIKDNVAGEKLTLDEIEHKILRKKFTEPRVHMALVCASLSCPALPNRAFTGDKLEEQLDKASREFLLDKTRNRFCSGCPQISLSKIFSWYGGDFEDIYKPDPGLKKRHGKKIAAVITFAASYFPPKTRDFLLSGDFKTNFLDYNWSLNE